MHADNVVTSLLNQSVKPPGTFSLDFEVQDSLLENKTPEEQQEIQIAYTSQILMNVFTRLAARLFGENVTASLTKDQFNQINAYINSFGYQAHHEVNVVDDTPVSVNLWFTKIE